MKTIYILFFIIILNAISFSQSFNNSHSVNDDEYDTTIPVLDWYTGISEIRGTTIDTQTFIVKILIGYKKGAYSIENAIIERRVQITDMFLYWFSRQKSAYLSKIDLRSEIREILKNKLNRILGKTIEDIRFEEFQILDF